MLKKPFRLKKNSAFSATYRIRKCVSDDKFIVYLGKEKPDFKIFTKAGFVVSKKVHKRAVKRNRIKRLARESYRHCLNNPEFSFIHNYLSIIFIAKSGALNSDFLAIEASVKNLLLSAKNKYQ